LLAPFALGMQHGQKVVEVLGVNDGPPVMAGMLRGTEEFVYVVGVDTQRVQVITTKPIAIVGRRFA
jgi:hypothetical protein